MKKIMWVVMLLSAVLMIAAPAAATTLTGSAGIFSVAACKDTTTVAVSGQSDYATNRVKVSIYKLNDNGDMSCCRRSKPRTSAAAVS
jgi:hypothetical protein